MKPRTTKKAPSKTEPAFSCTPQQRAAALKFVERTIEIQTIIGPCSAASGEPDILQQINEEYQTSVEFLLQHQKLTGSLDKKVPVCTAIINKEVGFILRIDNVLKNGELSKQAAQDDYLFAVNGRNAVAYEVTKTGKSKFTAKVYHNQVNDGPHGNHDVYSNWQLLDNLRWGHGWQNSDVLPAIRMLRNCSFPGGTQKGHVA